MTPNDYLAKILEKQTFDDDEPELKDLRRRRKEIEGVLRTHFSGSSPSIRWGGSMAKETMIRESYDGDMTSYFPHDEDGAGSTLEEIYDNTAEVLGKEYVVERKRSALRVRDPSTKASKGFAEDLHIDVVPGRFTGEDGDDVFLHCTTGDKQRLKTNLQVHIDHIRDSGVRDAIRLMKLWNVRKGGRCEDLRAGAAGDRASREEEELRPLGAARARLAVVPRQPGAACGGGSRQPERQRSEAASRRGAQSTLGRRRVHALADRELRVGGRIRGGRR
jgi:hypothetical protein